MSVTSAPAARRRRGNGVALLARDPVADLANRVDRLMGWAGGDEHALSSAAVLRAEQFFHRGGDFQRLGHAAGAAFAASAISPASGRRRQPSAMTCARLRWVALFAHIAEFIAGASRIFAVVASSTVVARSSEAAGHLGHQVGGRRRHHDEIAFARKTMCPISNSLARIDRSVRTRSPVIAPADTRDEMLGRLGQDAAYARPRSSALDEVERLVGGDAAADDQQHALGSRGRERRGQPAPLPRGVTAPRLRRPLPPSPRANGAHLVFDRAPLRAARTRRAFSDARRAAGR